MSAKEILGEWKNNREKRRWEGKTDGALMSEAKAIGGKEGKRNRW